MVTKDVRPINVLLIEDNPDDIAVIRHFLSNAPNVPYHLILADRLSKGLECLNNGAVDVVLLDLGLPDGHGLNTFASLHAQASHIPIIVLTGHVDDDMAIEAVRAGAQDFLVKGQVTGAFLRKSMRYAIERTKLLAELKRLNELLARQAATDTLTGISNRLRFDEALKAETARCMRFGMPLSLIMFDIDHFKNVNDTYGHMIGDEVLRKLAALVQNCVRIHDTFARWGGEEFMIMVTNSDADKARMFAEKLRALIEHHDFPAAGRLTCSFGVAQLMKEEGCDGFCQRADNAMYAAKARGRNIVVLAQSSDRYGADGNETSGAGLDTR